MQQNKLQQAINVETEAREAHSKIERLLQQRQVELAEVKQKISEANSQTSPTDLAQAMALAAALDRLLPVIEHELRKKAAMVQAKIHLRIRLEQQANQQRVNLNRLRVRGGTPQQIEASRLTLLELTGEGG